MPSPQPGAAGSAVAHAAATPVRAVFITRLNTANKGNEALSCEWIRLLRSHLTGGVSLAPRTPDHLLPFTVDSLGAAERAPAVFRGWADAIVDDWAKAPPPPAPPEPARVVLDERFEPEDSPIKKLKRLLKLRVRFAAIGGFKAGYGRRLSAFAEAGCVILNPAGEFWTTATDIPLRHLLDIYVAKRIGCRTAIVNHTFELVEPRLLEVVKVAYGAMDLISVREETSKKRLTDLGIDPEKILIAPDFVFMTEPTAAERAPGGGARIALCPNSAYLKNPAEEWSKLAGALLSQGHEVALVTNDFPIDHDTLDRLSERFDLPKLGAGLSYRDYSALLGGFDAVVSSRLHTCVMALTAGTPVVPVEGLDFKITAAMAAAGVPIAAVRPGDGDWVADVAGSIATILKDPAGARAWVADVVDVQRRGVELFLDRVKTELGFG